MNGGSPPTAPKARAGLLTPPGISRPARSNASRLRTRVGFMRTPPALTRGPVRSGRLLLCLLLQVSREFFLIDLPIFVRIDFVELLLERRALQLLARQAAV